MRHWVLGFGAAIGALAAMPASASTVVLANCVSVADVAGCLFDGNINGNTNPANVNSYLNAQNAYNTVRDPDITLNFLFDTDSGLPPGVSFTGAGTSMGTWSTPGYNIQYIAVKASNQFLLFQVSGSSGSWSTANIPYRNNPHDLSHLVFFGGAVPEPATWALMILGFGVAGASLRQRRKVRFNFA